MQDSKNHSSKRQDGTVNAVIRSFDILECLYDIEGGGVSGVANYLDIPKSTAHAHLQTLVSTGYIIQESDEYRIGLQFLKIGAGIRSDIKLYQTARPHLREIARKTEELTTLLVEEQGQGVVLYTVEGDNAIDDNTPVGTHVPLHTSAVGKSILAYLPDERVREITEEHGLRKYTPNTITSESKLFKELADIRTCGYAFNDEERSRGVRAVGVPIIREDGTVAGAVSVTGPVQRMTDTRIAREILESLLRMKNVIELKLSHY